MFHTTVRVAEHDVVELFCLLVPDALRVEVVGNDREGAALEPVRPSSPVNAFRLLAHGGFALPEPSAPHTKDGRELERVAKEQTERRARMECYLEVGFGVKFPRKWVWPALRPLEAFQMGCSF